MRMRNGFDNFERRFRIIRNSVMIIFAVTAIGIISWFTLVGVVGYKLSQDPAKTFETAGELTREWSDSFKKGYNTASSDSLTVDTLKVQ